MRRLYADGWVVTCDDEGTEHPTGWVLVEDGFVAAVGDGDEPEADERVELGGAVVTPGLVNTHHHLYQTLTRARAQQADLFTWLRELYPVWAGIDAEAEYARCEETVSLFCYRAENIVLFFDEEASPETLGRVAEALKAMQSG